MRFKGARLKTLHLPSGEWSYTTTYEAVCAMQAWGLLPSQWADLPDDDRAVIIAWHRTKGMMAGVEAVEQEREMRRAKRHA